jgi:arylsulfatase A-like enzyme
MESNMQQAAVKKRFLNWTAIGLIGWILTLAGCEPSTALRPVLKSSKKHPNIILLVTDDQRADSLGVVNPLLQTPRMDALANEGVLFRNAYVTTSICCCSRATLFSGQHTARHRIYDFKAMFSPEAASETYYGQLYQAGYRTGFIGKYGLGAGKTPPADAFDYWRGFMNQGKYETTDENGRYTHLTRVMGDQALEFLEGCSDKQAFCLSMSFKSPHCQDGDPRQFIYDHAYKELYEDVTFPVPLTADPQYWDQFPDFFKENNEARKRWQIRFSTPELYQQMVRNYHRLIHGVDVQIGRIRAKLEEKGLAENTVIILIGDNGFFLGEHGMAGKWYGQEESIRVPLIIYDPRLPQSQRGATIDQISLNIDIAPTILSAAGLRVPAGMQGESLLPLARGETAAWRQDFYYDHLVDIKTIPKCEGVVSKRWKYMRYAEADPVYEQLFDLKEDPQETRNLAASPEHQDILRQMQLRFEVLKKAAQ